MAGPSKQFNHDEALTKALDIFWLNGYLGTSMQDLVDEMGINRASMYQSYGNKQALYLSAIHQYIKNTLDFIHQELDNDPKPFEKLHRLLEQFIANSLKNNGNGCFINNAAVELATSDKLIAEQVTYFWRELENIFNTTLTNAVSKNELKKNIDTQKFALLINIMLQGLIIKTKSNASKKELFNALDTLFELIQR